MLCLAAFTINLDTTIVNVALPSLVRELGATTSELQWVVDAYLLSFAALVLAGGSLGDRFGRKGALLSGFALFGTASAVGGLVDTPTALAVVRALMGVGAALIFPATLSIISNLYTERHERARAIGIWGAMTGLGVVVGPIAGGWLLEHFWWGSVFVALAPVAAVGLLATALFVPTSRDPATPPLDLGGLGLSTLTMGTLVFTIIEAPDRGWTAPATIGGFAAAAIGAMVFVAWERRRAHPMLDISLFRNLRFTAASGSITTAFFALGGFTFLITQYFQFLKGYSPFSTGLRVLPVAIALVVGSITGVRLSVRIGNKVIVAAGLTMVGIGFAWVSTASIATSYLEIVGQMIVIGDRHGLHHRAGDRSDHGCRLQRKGRHRLCGERRHPRARHDPRRRGHRQHLRLALRLRRRRRPRVNSPVRRPRTRATPSAPPSPSQTSSAPPATRCSTRRAAAFFDGFQVGCLVAAGVLLIGAAFVARFLPARPEPPLDLSDLEHELALEPLTTTPNHEHDSGMVHPSND